MAEEIGATPSPQVAVTDKFLAWVKSANEAYERRRAEYREAYPIKAMEQLWKPQSMSELADYLRRRQTGRHKL